MAVDSTLLAYLVPRVTHSTENTAIEALGYILSRSAACRGALRDVLGSGGSDFGPIERVATQVSDEKGGRPDLAGFDEHGVERLLIEAKFWAALQPGQPNAYLRRLDKSDVSGPMALLFVAPRARFETLWAEVRRRARGEFELTEAAHQCSAAVVGSQRQLMLTSWEDLLSGMAAQAGEAGDSAAELDIRQLRGLCVRMDRDAFLPLRSEEFAPEFPRRVLGLRRLISAVTVQLRDAGLVSRRGRFTAYLGGYGRRLLLCGASVWLGVDFKLWANRDDTPLWLHFDEKMKGHTVTIDEIHRALRLSSDENHYAIRLKVGVEYEAVVDDAVDQLEKIGQTINPGFQPPVTP